MSIDQMPNEFPAFPLDQLALKGKADAPALKIRDRVYSYEELNLRIGRLAAWLAQQCEQKGARVASWMAKTELACLLPLATVRAGFVHVPCNPLLKAPQITHILDDSGAALLITNGARAQSLAGNETSIADEALVQAVLDDNAIMPLAPLPENSDTNALAAILYTSGSTGKPKGVMLSHANLVLGAISVAQYLRLKPDDVTLAVLPLSFDYGQNQLLSIWAAGGCAVPLDYLTPKDVIKACAKHQITTLAAVPPLWVQLVEHEWPTEATKYMRRLTNSGGALTPSLVKQLRSIFGSKTDIYAMYGITEAFRSTFLDPALIDSHPTSMGKAIPFAEINIVRADGSLTADGEHGEVVHSGPLVSLGYWNDSANRGAERFRPAPPLAKMQGRSVWSGDVAWRDANGLLYFVGRDDAMIKTSGNRVSPTEVEEAAVESGLVSEACALGRKDERLGAAIVLFVRASGNQAEAELSQHLKSALPNFMQPAEIIWLEQFPKNANGKLDRTALMARL